MPTLILLVEPAWTPGKHQDQSLRRSRACPGASTSSRGDGGARRAGPAGLVASPLSGETVRLQDAGASLEEAEVTLSFSLFLSLPASPLDV